MKRVFIDMDNVLVDFQSGLDQVSEGVKAEYAGRLDFCGEMSIFA